MLSELIKKYKLVIPAYLLTSTLTLGLPLCARWLLEAINVDIIKLEHWELFIPLALPWLFIFLLLRPRLALLHFEKDNSRFFYQFIAWGCLVLPGTFMQHLYTTATYPLVNLHVVQDLGTAKKSRFYQLENLSIVGNEASNYVDVRTAGDKNRDLAFTMYTVVPFSNTRSEALDRHYWLGFKQSQWISNSNSQSEKERLYDQFITDSWAELSAYDFDKVNYFEKLSKSTDKNFFIKAIEQSAGKISTPEDLVVLTPKLERFEDRNGDKLYWSGVSFAIGSLIFMVLLIFPPLCSDYERKLATGKFVVSNSFKDVIMFLLPNKAFFVLPLMLCLNVLVFLIVWLSGVDPLHPNGTELLSWGANRRYETYGGEWWRLLTSMFLHGGVMHLILNMYGLFIASLFVEPIFGKIRVAFLYFAAGLIGSLSSIFWYENNVSIGASGAIFGLFGALLALITTSIFNKEEKKSIFMMFAPYVGISLIMGLAGGIDNAAHIGGLLSGAILGLLMYYISGKKLNEL